MSKSNCDLTIIISSYKTDYVINCLDTIKAASKGLELETIVIDDFSPDRVDELIKKYHPWVKVVRRKDKGGFGKNNNIGMKMAKGRYLLLLNDDTLILDKNIFKEMVAWMDENPKVGVSSCALVNPDKKTYQGSGGYFPSLFKVFAWMTFIDDIPFLDKLIKPYHPLHGFSPFDKNEDYFKKPHKQDWLTGAFYLIRKSALDEVGLFDEEFHFYVEEVELSYRFYKKGWESWYLPKWKTLHFGMASSGNENATVMEMQNLKIFYKKHYPKWQLPLLTFILKFGALVRIVLFGILMGPKVAKIYAKAFRSI